MREVEIDGDGLDGGGGGQEETDEVKAYLDEVANRVKYSENYDNIGYETAIRSFLSKEQFITIPYYEEMINTFIEQGKVKGDTNNFDYVYAEQDDESESINMLIFITEEQFNYFQKSIIKASAKDFITSSFVIDNLEMIFAEDLSGEDAIKNKLAIDKEDFKFAIGGKVNGEFAYTILDDIDMSYFAGHFPFRSNEELILFDENETRKIFDVTITPLTQNANNRFSYLNFSTLSSGYTEDTIEIGNKNYKYLKSSNGFS